MKWRFIIIIFSSVASFLKLVFLKKLYFTGVRQGKGYLLPDKIVYSVFRETINDSYHNDRALVLVVGFRLRLLRTVSLCHCLFQRLCIVTTPFWSGLRGFHNKVWMVDQKTKKYAGVYEWYGIKNVEQYLDILLPLLYFFSVSGTVWYKLYKESTLEQWLRVNERR